MMAIEKIIAIYQKVHPRKQDKKIIKISELATTIHTTYDARTLRESIRELSVL